MAGNDAVLPSGLISRHGWLAFGGTAVAVAACYLELISRLGALWIGTALFSINVHLQAVLMWGFVLLAVVGLYFDRRVHGQPYALVLGIISFVLIFGTLYAYYDQRIELLGFITIIIAAFLNQFFMMEHLQTQVAQQARQVEDLNAELSARVAQQVDEIDRLRKLERFLPAKVAALVTEKGERDLLASHRRQIACLFCDIRNFTGFSESVEPEEVMEVLRNFHDMSGRLVDAHDGTIAYRAGDGLMVIFNDPLPCPDPVDAAARLALAIKAGFADIRQSWNQLGHPLGLGMGITYGYATIGLVGARSRMDYTAIGNVVNTASRLCDQAQDGQILLDQRAAIALAERADTREVGTLTLKGVNKPVEVVDLLSVS